jgi:PKD repeat protein
MKRSSFARCGAVVMVGTIASACTMKSQERPDLAGPSEFATAITISLTPDILQQDGASQSVVTITARGPNGAPLASVPLRAEIRVGGTPTDFGSLSARSLVTGTDGRATVVYTAPPSSPAAVSVDTFTVVDIGVTPLGNDFSNSTTRFASIRLVPRGVIAPPDGLRPAFTVSPSSPQDHQTVFFDGTSSTSNSNNPIASYEWNFGDGGRSSGPTTSHEYDNPGTYVVTLTISDALGRSASTSRTLDVGAGLSPTAAFAISPVPGVVNRPVNVNASASRPAPGRDIVSYSWDFGDGTSSQSGVQTSHTYTRAGTYSITLVVVDDAGRRAVLSQTVTIG